MTDMQTDAGRVGEHVEDVALGPAAPARGAERPVLVPVALPTGLDLEVVVGHVLLYPVAVVPVLRQNVVRAAGKRFGLRCQLNDGNGPLVAYRRSCGLEPRFGRRLAEPDGA